jgi:PKD repeat protein
MSRAPIAWRSVLVVLTVGSALLAPGLARAALPSFTSSPPAPRTGELVTFTSTFTGVTELWDLDGDGNCDDATGPSAQHSFETAGVYTVKLCVSDGVDEVVVTRKITILNRPPAAAFTYTPAAPLAGDQVVLTSVSVDSDGPITSVAWDLDNDGAFDDGTGASASFSFPAAGTYTVRLLVTDRDGAINVATQSIVVAERPPGLLSPFPMVRVVSRHSRTGTRIQVLTATVPPGSEVKFRCRGRGCPFRQLTRTAAAKRHSLVRLRRLRHSTLRPGAVVQVWVTKSEAIGKYTSIRIRRGKPPKREDRCVLPGAKHPAPCLSALLIAQGRARKP